MSNSFYTARGYQLQNEIKHSLSPSREDYLEMIYRNISENEKCRVTTLALELNVRPSSVSKMLYTLNKLGYIEYEKYGMIVLTEKGAKEGKYLLWRHNVIAEFFNLISGEDNDTAFEETELVEHILTKRTVEKFERLNEFIKSSNFKA